MRALRVVIVVLFVTVSLALDNGVGRTPAMGYNTWYDVGCSHLMRENTIKLTVDAFIDLGLDKLGYQYVNLDDCWMAGRTPNGVLYPDAVRFPSGIASLANYIHSRNLKFGIYTDRGNMTCAGFPASKGHEKIDAQTFASWGVDFLKEDSCNATQNHDAAFYEYGLMRDAMNATGRPIYFDICGWNDWYAPVGASLGNEWRIGPDDGEWDLLLKNINIDAKLSQYAGPGGWNNPCLLIGTTADGEQIITELQSRFQFTMWAMLAAPLVLSTNIRELSDYMIDTYTNAEVIAVDQDRLGKQGIRIYGEDLTVDAGIPGSINVWARQLYDKSWALAFVNVGKVGTTVPCDYTCLSHLGYTPGKAWRVRDLWNHVDLGTFNGTLFTARSVQAAGGVAMYKFTPI